MKGCAYLKEFPNLRELNLIETPITDEGLAQLVNCPELIKLYLSGTKVTDAGLVHLQRIRTSRNSASKAPR